MACRASLGAKMHKAPALPRITASAADSRPGPACSRSLPTAPPRRRFSAASGSWSASSASAPPCLTVGARHRARYPRRRHDPAAARQATAPTSPRAETCHRGKIDPLYFALESFDVMARLARPLPRSRRRRAGNCTVASALPRSQRPASRASRSHSATGRRWILPARFLTAPRSATYTTSSGCCWNTKSRRWRGTWWASFADCSHATGAPISFSDRKQADEILEENPRIRLLRSPCGIGTGQRAERSVSGTNMVQVGRRPKAITSWETDATLARFPRRTLFLGASAWFPLRYAAAERDGSLRRSRAKRSCAAPHVWYLQQPRRAARRVLPRRAGPRLHTFALLVQSFRTTARTSPSSPASSQFNVDGGHPSDISFLTAAPCTWPAVRSATPFRLSTSTSPSASGKQTCWGQFAHAGSQHRCPVPLPGRVMALPSRPNRAPRASSARCSFRVRPRRWKRRLRSWIPAVRLSSPSPIISAIWSATSAPATACVSTSTSPASATSKNACRRQRDGSESLEPLEKESRTLVQDPANSAQRRGCRHVPALVRPGV